MELSQARKLIAKARWLAGEVSNINGLANVTAVTTKSPRSKSRTRSTTPKRGGRSTTPKRGGRTRSTTPQRRKKLSFKEKQDKRLAKALAAKAMRTGSPADRAAAFRSSPSRKTQDATLISLASVKAQMGFFKQSIVEGREVATKGAAVLLLLQHADTTGTMELSQARKLIAKARWLAGEVSNINIGL